MIHPLFSDAPQGDADGEALHDPAEHIILALDRPDADSALALVAALPDLRWVKVGLELFTAAGPGVVRSLRQRGLKVFLDLKFHDIPATMAAACRSAVRLGAELLTLHACAGSEALAAARQAAVDAFEERAGADDQQAPRLLAVTVLTSWTPERFGSELAIREALPAHVERLAALAHGAGLDGAVCSPLEVELLRRRYPRPFELVTPGIRPAGAPADDQKRLLRPAEALAAGASRLVIGRPISAAADPAAVFAACCAELAAACS